MTESQEEITAPISDVEAVCIRYPGIVRNVGAAIESLGGDQALSSAIQASSAYIRCKFRPGDRYCHPLFGEKRACCKLLLRVSRKRQDPADTKPNVKIVQVQSIYEFNGLSDFQFVGNNRAIDRTKEGMPIENRAGEAEPMEKEEPLLVVPPFFSRADVPYEYAYKSDPTKLAGSTPGHLKQKWVTVSYDAASVPMPDADISGLFQLPSETLRCVLQCLQTRPIWTQPLLLERIGNAPRTIIEQLLKALTYGFHSGPWQGLWVRRGFDPRQDAATSAPLQRIIATLPDDWFSALPAAIARGTVKSGATQPLLAMAVEQQQQASSASNDDASSTSTTFRDICRFARVPIQKHTMLQLCDIDDDDVRAALRDTPLLPQHNVTTGWIPPSTLERIERRVLLRFTELLQRHMSVPPAAAAQPPATAGPANAAGVGGSDAATAAGAQASAAATAAATTTGGAADLQAWLESIAAKQALEKSASDNASASAGDDAVLRMSQIRLHEDTTDVEADGGAVGMEEFERMLLQHALDPPADQLDGRDGTDDDAADAGADMDDEDDDDDDDHDVDDDDAIGSDID